MGNQETIDNSVKNEKRFRFLLVMIEYQIYEALIKFTPLVLIRRAFAQWQSS